jgi:hypothetical protein
MKRSRSDSATYQAAAVERDTAKPEADGADQRCVADRP